MPVFEYSGQLGGHSAISGTLEAVSHDEAVEKLTNMGIRNLTVVAAEKLKRSPTLSHDDLMFLNEQLASLADSGSALDKGLRAIATDIGRGKLKRGLNQLADHIEKGMPLDRAIAAESAAFPPFYSHVMHCGIANGNLGATLLNLNSHLSVIAAMKRLLWEAAIYPIGVFVLLMAVITMFMNLVMPELASAVMDTDTEMPAITQFMLQLGAHWNSLLLGMGAAVAVGVIFLLIARSSPHAMVAIERLLWRVPVLGSVLRASTMARFTRAAALGASGGQDLPTMLKLAAGATGNLRVERSAAAIAQHVEQGGSPMSAESDGVIPQSILFAAEIGGARGELTATMTRIADSYDAITRYRLTLLRALLIPLGIVMIGGFVMVAVVTIYVPALTTLRAFSSFLYY